MERQMLFSLILGFCLIILYSIIDFIPDIEDTNETKN